MFILLNNYQYCVVMRHCRPNKVQDNNKMRGEIVQYHKTLANAKDDAKNRSNDSNEYYFWAMPISEY